jgi:hypothetical protein
MPGAQAPLHVAVIRFNAVVTLSLCSLLAAAMEVIFLLQFRRITFNCLRSATPG